MEMYPTMYSTTPDDFFDYQSKETLFNNVEKDENDQFQLKITKKEKLTHDTILIRLSFGNDKWISGLWVGGHFVFHAEIDGKTVTRKYTPISTVNTLGYVEFAIKVYREHSDFPGGGKMSSYLDKR